MRTPALAAALLALAPFCAAQDDLTFPSERPTVLPSEVKHVPNPEPRNDFCHLDPFLQTSVIQVADKPVQRMIYVRLSSKLVGGNPMDVVTVGDLTDMTKSRGKVHLLPRQTFEAKAAVTSTFKLADSEMTVKIESGGNIEVTGKPLAQPIRTTLHSLAKLRAEALGASPVVTVGTRKYRVAVQCEDFAMVLFEKASAPAIVVNLYDAKDKSWLLPASLGQVDGKDYLVDWDAKMGYYKISEGVAPPRKEVSARAKKPD